MFVCVCACLCVHAYCEYEMEIKYVCAQVRVYEHMIVSFLVHIVRVVSFLKNLS